MDPANLGVVLDSSIVIDAERQQLDAARIGRTPSIVQLFVGHYTKRQPTAAEYRLAVVSVHVED